VGVRGNGGCLFQYPFLAQRQTVKKIPPSGNLAGKSLQEAAEGDSPDLDRRTPTNLIIFYITLFVIAYTSHSISPS